MVSVVQMKNISIFDETKGTGEIGGAGVGVVQGGSAKEEDNVVGLPEKPDGEGVQGRACAECGAIVENWCYDSGLKLLCQPCGHKKARLDYEPVAKDGLPEGKALGPSITLHGSGDRSGRDVNNSMGLSEAYRWVVL